MRIDERRTYEMVTPEELRQNRARNLKYADLQWAIRALKKMAVGEGIKIKCPTAHEEAVKKRKAAFTIAYREKLRIRTMLRGEWLFIERV